MKANLVLLFALLGGIGIAGLVGGCGNSTKSTVTVGADGAIYVGTNTIQTRTRTVQGTTETIYIHRGPVSAANTTHVVVKRLPHLGMVLVNGKGGPLYAFVPGEHGPKTCTGSCAETWLPIRLTIEMATDSSPELEESLVSTEPDPEHHEIGDRVVKFAGHVLHSYAGDKSAGVASGEGMESYGGHWYVVAPSGRLVMRRY